MTMSDLHHCGVHPSHLVVVNLVSATESHSVTAHGETLRPENNRVVGEIGHVPYEATSPGKRVDAAQCRTVEQHESFRMLVIEYQGQPAQADLDVSEVKSVAK